MKTETIYKIDGIPFTNTRVTFSALTSEAHAWRVYHWYRRNTYYPIRLVKVETRTEILAESRAR